MDWCSLLGKLGSFLGCGFFGALIAIIIQRYFKITEDDKYNSILGYGNLPTSVLLQHCQMLKH